MSTMRWAYISGHALAATRKENDIKLYVLLAMLVESAQDDPEPEVAVAQLMILVAELRHQNICVVV